MNRLLRGSRQHGGKSQVAHAAVLFAASNVHTDIIGHLSVFTEVVPFHPRREGFVERIGTFPLVEIPCSWCWQPERIKTACYSGVEVFMHEHSSHELPCQLLRVPAKPSFLRNVLLQSMLRLSADQHLGLPTQRRRGRPARPLFV